MENSLLTLERRIFVTMCVIELESSQLDLDGEIYVPCRSHNNLEKAILRERVEKPPFLESEKSLLELDGEAYLAGRSLELNGEMYLSSCLFELEKQLFELEEDMMVPRRCMVEPEKQLLEFDVVGVVSLPKRFLPRH
jgi:hypothetical protein